MMEHRKSLIQAFLTTLAASACFLALLYCAYSFDNKYTDRSPNPINGILAITDHDLKNDVLFLANGWQFYDHKLLTPDVFNEIGSLPPLQFITIGKYNDFSFGQIKKSPYGEASYRLILDLPQHELIYSLDLPEIYSAYNCYINSDLVLSMGDLTSDKETIGRKTITFSANGRTEVLITVKNTNHYYSGMTFPPAFGLSSQILHYQNTKLLLHSILMALIFLLFLFSGYFGIRLKSKEAVILSLFSLCLLIQTAYPVFFTFCSVHNQLYFSIELLSIYGTYLLVVSLQHFFFNKATIGFTLFRTILGIFTIITFLYGILAIPNAAVHQWYSIFVSLIKIALALYLIVNTLYSAIHNDSNTYLGSILTGVIAVSLFADRLYPFYEPIYGGFFTEYSGLILVLLGAFYLWGHLTEAYRFQVSFTQEKKLLTRQVAIQKSHYTELTKKVEEARKQRHDIRHHLKTIGVFLTQKKYEQATAYLANCNVETGSFEPLVLCENTVADALFQYYSRLCNENKIKLSVAAYIPAQILIEDTDLTIIFGNLLENAYDACLAYAGSSPQISVKASFSDTGLAFYIENTFSETIHKKADHFYSTKHDGFGIGTASVREVVSKYHGMSRFDCNGDKFCVSILMQTS